MAPNSYTELFFLDEATALAAGHRPCGTCRKDQYRQFVGAFSSAQGLDKPMKVGDIDAILRQECSSGQIVEMKGCELPGGVMVLIDDTPWLVHENELYPWSFEGYGTPEPIDLEENYRVLTPPSIVGAMANGYVYVVHPSLVTGGEVVDENVESDAPSKPAQTVSCDKDKSHQDGKEVSMYRREETPSGGRELWTYMAALLEVSGMIDGQSFPIKRVFSNIKTHQDAGRIVKDGNLWRLSESGVDYFKDRFEPGSRQRVYRQEVDAEKRMMENGGPGWIELSL